MTVLRDLRQGQRIRLVRPLYGHSLDARDVFTLRDIGADGFSVEGAVRFSAGDACSFTFEVPPGREAVLTGTVKHCAQLNNGRAGPLYLAGFEFRAPEDAAAIMTLLDAAQVLGDRKKTDS